MIPKLRTGLCMDTTSPSDFEDQIETLLSLAGRQAVSDPTPSAFTQWFKWAVPKLMPVLLKQIPPVPEEIDRFLRTAALNLFADLPMPDHDLQPVGQPKQGRNDPCACGSGQKYKHCCGANAMPPLFGNLNLLRYVLDAYPKSRLGDVCASKASIDAVADTAFRWLAGGDATRASALLEPYFSGTAPLTVKVAPLFNLLMDSWLELGHRTKRERLIDTILQRGDRPLKSDALQRRTTMLADQGDHAGAWRSFKQASELNPNDPALSFLEVTTLLSEGRVSEAQSRAQWWAAFLAKQRDPQLADLVDRLRDIAKDPHAGMMGVATSANADLQRLHGLFLAAPPPALRHRGDVFMEESEQRAAHAVASELVPDADLAKLEKRWQKVFRQVKPSLTALQNDVEEVWDNAPAWLALLQKHPALWFSFDVLDDLVMAVDTVHWAGVKQRLLVPMAERAAEQLRMTLESRESGPVECPWGVLSNRPILRPIVHLAYICKEAKNWQRFMELAHWLVFELNSNDNHGLRDDLSCAYVRFARWTDVLALNDRYPDDMQPSLVLNAVLATFSLGGTTKAQETIKLAKKDHPVAVKMLLEAAPKPVKPDSGYGITVGGKYEAWLYVGKMREFWDRHKALDWARDALKPAKGKPRMLPPEQQSLL
jgi:tetratricopeptide (TPR) repeat protein